MKMGKMEEFDLEGRFPRTEGRVKGHLVLCGCFIPSTRIVRDPELDEDTLVTDRYPGTVVVRETSVPESDIAHELVHLAQGTSEQFPSFQSLYTLLVEGLADWVAKQLYPEHEVKYQAGHRLIELLLANDESSVGGLFRLNDLSLVAQDMEAILGSSHLAAYSCDLPSPIAGRIRNSIPAAKEAGLTDPTFAPLGEEMRTWKLLLDSRYGAVSEEVDRVVEKWFRSVS
jgi:hypothetical protein